MKVGVVSDRHGNLAYLKRAAERLSQEDVEIIIHLGDDFKDTNILSEFDVKVLRVRG